MGRKCLLCSANTDTRESIENFVKDGGNYNDAAIRAKQTGLNVSSTSVQRHIENHTKIEYIADTQNDSFIGETIDIQSIVEGADNIDDLLNKEMSELLSTLVILCNHSLKKYANGVARFPANELRALTSIYAQLNKRGDVFKPLTSNEDD